MRRWGLLVVGVVLGQWGSPLTVAAPPMLERVEVPADRVDLWPRFTTELIAVSRADFERRWSQIRPRPAAPPTAWLERARYTGLAEGARLAGTFEWVVRNTDPRGTWLALPGSSVALRELQGAGPDPLLWGTGDDGRLWLFVEQASAVIRGRWELSGDVTAERATFAIRLPPALATEMALTTSPGHQLSSDRIAVRRATAESAEQRATWELFPGSQSDFTVLVDRPESTTTVPLITYRRQLSAALREDHVRFEAAFQAEVLGGTVDVVEFTAPQAAEIYAVTWGGELPLAWSAVAENGPRRRFRVKLPDQLTGPLRQIRLEGIVPQRPESATTLPEIDLQGGVFRAGSIEVSVARPLQVEAIRTQGCRQEAPLLAASEGESYRFVQTAATSQVLLEVRRPPSSLSATVLSSLECDTEEWLWRVEMLWSSSSGSAFQLTTELPRGWELSDVKAYALDGVEERINWELLTEANAPPRLAVELLEALTPDRPRRLRLWLRRTAPTVLKGFACPVLIPTEGESYTQVAVVSGGRPYEIYVDGPTRGEPLDPESLGAPWTAMAMWSTLPLRDRERRWLRITEPSGPPALTLYDRLVPVRAELGVQVEAAGALLTEVYTLRLRPVQAGPLPRVLVALSQPGEELSWSVRAPDDWQRIATRIPLEHRPAGGNITGGELWELRLPTIPVEEVVLEGTRVRPLTLPGRVGLVELPQAVETTGEVTFLAATSSGLQTVTRGLTRLPITPPATEPAGAAEPALVMQGRWKLQGPAAELTILSRRSSLQNSPCAVALELQSVLTSYQAGEDLHRATLSLPEFPREVRFRLPPEADWVAADLNGQSIRPNDGALVVPPRGLGGTTRLVMVYRARPSAGFWSERRPIPLPLSDDVVWTAARWDFALPPEAKLWAEPAGMRLTIPPATPTWSDRWFGPLSRGGAPMFLPWDPESWRSLNRAARPSAIDPQVLTEALATPPGWTRHTALAPVPPARLELKTFHRSRWWLLSWLSLTATMLIVLGMRWAKFRYRGRFAAIWLAAWAGIAVAVEPPWIHVVGGLLVGSVCGWLLPRTWLRRPAPRARLAIPTEGSTRSFLLPTGAIGTTVVLIVASWFAAVTDAALPDLDPRAIVLVPLNDRGQPTPLLYLHPETWNTIVTLSTEQPPERPTVLVRRVDYRAALGLGQRVAVRAELEVLVLGHEPQVSWALPLGMTGPLAAQSCLVDGRPATITQLTEGAGFQLSWPRTAPPLSAIDQPAGTRHVIQLEWQQSWRRESGLAVFELGTPAATATRGALGGLPIIEPPKSRGPWPPAITGLETPAEVTRDFGLPASWRVAWREAGATAEPHDTQVDVAELWRWQGQCLEVRTRTTFKPRTGTARRMYVRWPAGGIVRRWSSSAPGEWRVVPLAEGGVGGLWEFTSPLSTNATVDLEFVIPRAAQSEEVRWQGLKWSTAPGITLTPGLRWLAVSTPDEYRLVPEALEDSGLAPVALEAARPVFGDFLADRVPQAVYQTGMTDQAVFQLVPTVPVRRQLLWQQTGTIDADRVVWELQGELEVSGLPVYSHVLTIDRRLKIESISVRERGVERRVRTSESRTPAAPGQTRITLFLSAAATGTQQITVRASLPLTPGKPVPLPNIRCEETQLSGGRVALRGGEGVEWSLPAIRGLTELTQVADSAVTGAVTRIFDQTEIDWRATLVVQPTAGRVAPRVIHQLASDDPQSITLTARWRMPPARGTDARTILVPAPWELSPESHVVGGKLETQRDPDGVWTLAIRPTTATAELLVELRLQAQRVALRDQTVPLPSLLTDPGTEGTAWLVELTRMPQSPLVDSALGLLTGSPPADWGTGQWSEPALEENDRLRWWSLPSTARMVPLADPNRPTEAVAIPWWEHHLWPDPVHGTIGRTQLRLAAPVSLITAQFPGAMVLEGALIAGRAGVTRVVDDQQVQISARDGNPFVEVWLLWRDPVSVASRSPLTTLEYHLPRIPGARATPPAISFMPPADTLLAGIDAWSVGDWMDRALLRLEVLDDQRRGLPTDWAARLEGSLRTGYQRTAEHLGAVHDEFAAAEPQRHARWKQLVDGVNQLPATATFDPRAADAPPRWVDDLLTHRDAKYGTIPLEVDAGRYWCIDRGWLRGLAAVSLTIIAWPLLWFLMRPAAADWWQQHPRLAAAFVGAVWWTWLSPSLFGFAILMAALGTGVLRRVTSPTPPAPASPSTPSAASVGSRLGEPPSHGSAVSS